MQKPVDEKLFRIGSVVRANGIGIGVVVDRPLIQGKLYVDVKFKFVEKPHTFRVDELELVRS